MAKRTNVSKSETQPTSKVPRWLTLLRAIPIDKVVMAVLGGTMVAVLSWVLVQDLGVGSLDAWVARGVILVVMAIILWVVRKKLKEREAYLIPSLLAFPQIKSRLKQLAKQESWEVQGEDGESLYLAMDSWMQFRWWELKIAASDGGIRVRVTAMGHERSKLMPSLFVLGHAEKAIRRALEA